MKKIENSNPWKTLSRQEVYDNPWIQVEEHQVLNPSGNPGIYGTVHFKNLAIGIIPVDEEGNTYLVGQYRYPLKAYSWEIPMGGGPLHEEPLLTAKRELKEETGITAQRWSHLLAIHTSNSTTDEAGCIYLAEQLSQGRMDLDDTEDIRVKKLPLMSALHMALDGEITDSLSLAGLFKLALLRKLM